MEKSDERKRENRTYSSARHSIRITVLEGEDIDLGCDSALSSSERIATMTALRS
jgi:hypothetical protein